MESVTVSANSTPVVSCGRFPLQVIGGTRLSGGLEQ
jgi:hypothetical protein